MISSITTEQLRDLIKHSMEDLPDWDPSFGLTEPQQAFAQAASPQIVLALLDQLDAYQQGAKAEADAGDEARREAKRWKGMVHMMVTQHMPRESIPDLPGWSRVVEAESLVAQVKNLKALLEDQEALRNRAEYWKQRAKSAEGHFWTSDFQAACDAVHKISNYSDIATAALSMQQKASIAHAASAVLVSVNARRAVRLPHDAEDMDSGKIMTRQEE